MGAHPWARSAGSGSPLHPLSPQRPTGEVYDIEIDTLETTCHVLDPTPLANCSVRQQTEHVSGPLRATAGWGGVVPQLKLPVDGALPSAHFFTIPLLVVPRPPRLPRNLCKTSVLFQYHQVKEIL